MNSDEPAATSRRTLLRAGGAAAVAGAAGLVSACGSASPTSTQSNPLTPGAIDVGILNHALDLKNYVVAAYTATAPLLTGRAHAAAKKFLGEDLTHASTLISMIQDAGGNAVDPQPTYDLGHPRGREGILQLLDTAENHVISSFIAIIPAVTPGQVRAQLASIVANDAQHVTVLRLLLGRPPIPSAFVTGHE